MHSSSLARFTRSGQRGSALLVSLLFSAIIAISLASFLNLASSATKLSYRTYYLGVGMNIAETGLEQAVWSINRSSSGGTGAWTDWEADPSSSNTWRRTFDLGTVEGGSTAQVKVYARERNGAAMPLIVARAIITPPSGSPVEKWIKVTLSRRSVLAVGGLGRDGIRASGNNVYFASWNSNPDKDAATPYIPFSEAVKRDKMSLATLDLDAELNSGQADVNGKAAVGSDDLNDIKVGSQGYIGPFGTEAGTKDPASVSTDFTADLKIPEAPENVSYTALGAITTDTELPEGTASAQDGVYYYTASEISLNGKVLSIKPGYHVVIHVPNNLSAVSIGGNDGAIKINGAKDPITGVLTTSTLELYTPGNVNIGGKGSANEISWTESTDTIQTVVTRERIGNKWVNTVSEVTVTATETITQVGQPIAFQVYGTRTPQEAVISGNQSISISGNGNLSGVIYAPYADVSAKGGGNSGFMYGSLVGASLTFTGNDSFYYDESLADREDDGRFGIDNWAELVGNADRATYGSLMDF